MSELLLPERRHLPDTRRSITIKRSMGKYEVYVCVGFYDDGTAECPIEDRSRPGEVFVTIAKHGSDLGGLGHAVALLVSVALQYGVPWSVLEERMRHIRFGEATDEQNTSMVDGIAQAITQAIDTKRRADE